MGGWLPSLSSPFGHDLLLNKDTIIMGLLPLLRIEEKVKVSGTAAMLSKADARRFFAATFLQLAACSAVAVFQGCAFRSMPGQSFKGPLPALTAQELQVRDNLRRHVQTLAGDIGERNHARPEAYQRAEDYIAETFRRAGYSPRLLQERQIKDRTVHNIEAELPGTGRPEEILVIGAHFDSEEACPGANDNASGVAALLEIARLCSGHSVSRTIRFVAFYDEEEFGERPMGSRRYAGNCHERRDSIQGMICLETMGYYSDQPHSQRYPLPFSFFYPGTGDFIAFVGNNRSRDLLRECIGSFRDKTKFPSEGFKAPWYALDAGRSDHSSFWKEGYRALVVTDTADFRYGHYHESDDTADKVDYDRTARVTVGLVQVIIGYARRDKEVARLRPIGDYR